MHQYGKCHSIQTESGDATIQSNVLEEIVRLMILPLFTLFYQQLCIFQFITILPPIKGKLISQLSDTTPTEIDSRS